MLCMDTDTFYLSINDLIDKYYNNTYPCWTALSKLCLSNGLYRKYKKNKVPKNQISLKWGVQGGMVHRQSEEKPRRSASETEPLTSALESDSRQTV